MRILLDGTPCELQVGSIRDAVEQVTEQALASGRVIIQVDVDGREMDLDELEGGLDGMNLPGELAFSSLTPDELLLATFELGEQAIASAQTSFEQAATLIQSGEGEKALDELRKGIDLWKTVEETVLREAVPELEGQEAALEDRIEDLRASLNSIREAMMSRDMTALSDALLYEFPRTSAECSSFLKECSDSINTGRTGDQESSA